MRPTKRPRTVAELMRTEVVTVPATATLHDLAVLLSRHGISAVPVIDEKGGVIGMASATDLLWQSDQVGGLGRFLAFLAARHVREIMTPDVFALPPSASVNELLPFLVRHGVHRALVMSDTEQLLGIVSLSDLLGILVGEARVEDEMRTSMRHAAPEAEAKAVREELARLRHQLALLEERVTELEVREELTEAPAAAGDQPVAR